MELAMKILREELELEQASLVASEKLLADRRTGLAEAEAAAAGKAALVRDLKAAIEALNAVALPTPTPAPRLEPFIPCPTCHTTHRLFDPCAGVAGVLIDRPDLANPLNTPAAPVPPRCVFCGNCHWPGEPHVQRQEQLVPTVAVENTSIKAVQPAAQWEPCVRCGERHHPASRLCRS